MEIRRNSAGCANFLLLFSWPSGIIPTQYASISTSIATTLTSNNTRHTTNLKLESFGAWRVAKSWVPSTPCCLDVAAFSVSFMGVGGCLFGKLTTGELGKTFSCLDEHYLGSLGGGILHKEEECGVDLPL